MTFKTQVPLIINYNLFIIRVPFWLPRPRESLRTYQLYWDLHNYWDFDNYLEKVFNDPDIARYFLIIRVHSPDQSVGSPVQILPRPINRQQEVLGHWDGDNDVQLSIVEHHLLHTKVVIVTYKGGHRYIQRLSSLHIKVIVTYKGSHRYIQSSKSSLHIKVIVTYKGYHRYIQRLSSLHIKVVIVTYKVRHRYIQGL